MYRIFPYLKCLTASFLHSGFCFSIYHQLHLPIIKFHTDIALIKTATQYFHISNASVITTTWRCRSNFGVPV